MKDKLDDTMWWWVEGWQKAMMKRVKAGDFGIKFNKASDRFVRSATRFIERPNPHAKEG